MRLEAQVCSLVLAKRLKELGVKQDSVHHWVFNRLAGDYFLTQAIDFTDKLSAFTVAELGEFFIWDEDKHPWFEAHSIKVHFNNNHDWACEFEDSENADEINFTVYAETEANARAKMLIFLIEKKLIEVPKNA